MADVNPPDDLELPRAVALAWGVAAHPQRGPKRELSVERIVEAAVAIADADGLGAVSMSAVASSLGFTTMALYRYVTAKDDLVMLMQEHALGVPPEWEGPDGTPGPPPHWRTGFRYWTDAQVALYHRHPWVLDVVVEGTPTSPNNMAWLDAGLSLLDGTSLTQDERLAVVLAVLAQTRWRASIEVSYVRAAAASGGSPDDLDAASDAVLRALVTAEEFPHVRRAVDAGSFAGGPQGGDPFAVGLDLVLDGVEALLAGRPAPEVTPAVDGPDVLGDKAVREAGKKVREATKQLRDARRDERRALAEARRRVPPSR